MSGVRQDFLGNVWKAGSELMASSVAKGATENTLYFNAWWRVDQAIAVGYSRSCGRSRLFGRSLTAKTKEALI